ncbi:MAG: flagellar biosynthetic protein FliR [Pirellulaceae bacterium]
MQHELTQAWILTFTLILARVAALIATVPLFGGNNLPNLVKVGFSLSLAAMWFGAFGAEPTEDVRMLASQAHWLGIGLATLREVIFGAVLGFTFNFAVNADANRWGLYRSRDGVVDGVADRPDAARRSSVVAQLFDAFGILLFFGLDIHHAMLTSVHSAFERWPCGSPMSLTAPAYRVAVGFADSQEWALQIAAPVGVCLFLTLVVLFLMAKASPQLNLFTFGMPVRLAIGLVGMLLFLPDTFVLVQRLFVKVGGIIVS